MNTDTETLELLARISKGDNFAFEELTEKYRTIIESAAASAVRSMQHSDLDVTSETSYDLKQEATLALYRAALKYDPDGDGKSVTFGLYAKICVRNALISELRRMGAKKRRADRLAKSELAMDRGTTGNNTSSVISKVQLEQLLRGSINVLSKYEMKVFSEYVGGKTIAEICDELGKSQKSVNNALYRIRVKLKEFAGDTDIES